MRNLKSVTTIRVAAMPLLGALLVAGSAATAQSVTTVSREVAVHDARWQPWLGCWKPAGSMTPVVSAGESISAAAPTMICVVPSNNATGVEVVNFSGGSITDRTTIDPGQVIAKKVDDCSGQEVATWSADGRRVLLRGTFNCGRGIARVESGVMSIDADGQWVQAQSVKVGANVTSFVAEFRETGILLEGIRDGAIVERPMLDLSGKRLSPPRDGCTGSDAVKPSADGQRIVVLSDFTCTNGLHRIADAQFVRGSRGEWVRDGGPNVLFGTSSVRAAAGAPVTTDDVLEIAKLVDANVAEAWFSSRGQAFDLTGRELVRLSDAGMPARLIDMLVAVSNPKSFTIQHNEGASNAKGRSANATDTRVAGGAACSLPQDYCFGMMGLGWMYGADRYYGWSPYGYSYGSRYGYGYGSGYPYGGSYWGPGYYYGNGPIVVVGRPSEPAAPPGRAVYGQGYTRDKPITYSAPTSTSSGSGTSRASDPGSSSSGSSSSGGSSSGGSTGRTAIPRPPGGL